MNNDYPELRKYLQGIPSYVQDIIVSDEFKKVLDETARNNALSEIQKTRFINETILVMIGAESGSSYISNLREALNITPERANAIAHAAGIVFEEVEDFLRSLHKKAEGESTGTPTSITTTPHNDSASPLAAHIAQFQQRKKQKEQETAGQKVPVAPNAPQPAAQQAKPDPYREPIA